MPAFSSAQRPPVPAPLPRLSLVQTFWLPLLLGFLIGISCTLLIMAPVHV
jgi:hypothetical protein